MIPNTPDSRQYRTLEALALAALLVAIAITKLLWNGAVVEYNPLVPWALGHTGWLVVGTAALAITAGQFSLLRWADARWGTSWFDRLAVLVAAMSVGNALNDLWVLHQHGVPETIMLGDFGVFVATAGLAAVALFARSETVAAIRRVPAGASSQQARALGLVTIMVLSLPAMFAVSLPGTNSGGVAEAQASNWPVKHDISISGTPNIFEIETSPDGSQVAVATDGGNVKIYDIESGNVVKTLTNGSSTSSNFRSVAWSPDGNRLAYGTEGSEIYVVETGTWNHVELISSALSDTVWALTYSDDGSQLAAVDSGANGQDILIFSTSDWTTDQTLTTPFGGSGTLSLDWNANYLAAGGANGEIEIFDSSDWSNPQTLTQGSGDGDAVSVEFTQDGTQIAYAVKTNGDTYVHSTSDWSLTRSFGLSGPATVAWGPDGNYLGYGEGGSTYSVYDDADSNNVSFSTSTQPDESDFTPRGGHLVHSDGDGNGITIRETPINIPSLTVNVVDQNGEPVANANISTSVGKTGTTDSSGTASFTLSSAKTVDVTAETAIDTKTQTVDVPSDGTSVTFELTPGDIQVVDQDGQPVEGATVVATGPRDSALDASAANPDELRVEAQALLDDLSEGIEPDNWKPDLSTDGIVGNNDQYVFVHNAEKWETLHTLGTTLGAPIVQTEGEDVVFSVWDAEKDQSDILSSDPVCGELPGCTTNTDIVLEQLGPNGEVIDKKTFTPQEVAQTYEWFGFDDNEHRVVRRALPAGNFYRVYPKGYAGNAYIIASGNPSEIVDGWAQGLETEADQLTQRAERIENLINQDDLWINRSVTGSQGQVTFDSIPSDVQVVDVRAVKGPDPAHLQQALDEGVINTSSRSNITLTNLTIQDMRDIRNAEIFNGDVFVGERERIESLPATVQGERLEAVPYDPIRNGTNPIDDIREIVNDTIDQLPDFETGDLSDLIALRQKLQNQTKDIPGFMEHYESEYPEFVSGGEYDFPTPESVSEVQAQIKSITHAVSTFDGVDPGDIDSDIGEIANTLTKVIHVPDVVRRLDFIENVVIQYADEPDGEIGEEYLNIERRSPPDEDTSGQWKETVLVIDGYPIESTNITGVAVDFQAPWDNINETIGEVVATFSQDIPIPSEISDLSQIYNVSVVYNNTMREPVAPENLTVFDQNDTLRISDHPANASAEIVNVDIEFAEISKVADNITYDPINGSTEPTYLNTSFEVAQPPGDISLGEQPDQVSAPLQNVLAVFEPQTDAAENSYHVISPSYINVSDPDADNNANISVLWPIPDSRSADNFLELKLQGLDFANAGGGEIDPDLDVDENTTRYLNTTVQLDNDYASVSDLTTRVFYADAEPQPIAARYLSLNATSNVLTIDNFPISDRAISYIQVSGNGQQVINDTGGVEEVAETLQGRIGPITANINSTDQLTAVAHWQNGDVEQIGPSFLTLEPAMGTHELGSGDPGVYLLIDGYPTNGRTLEKVDVSVGTTNETVEPIEGGQFLDAEISFEDGLFTFNDLSTDDVTIFAEWQDGSTTTIPQQYWEIDGQLTGVGTILISDYPIPEDKVAGNVEVIARAGEEVYRVSDRVESPEYSGDAADLKYVAVSNLQPRAGDIVQVRSELDDNATSVELTNATVVSPRGNSMDVEVGDDGAVSFPTGDGPGTYRIDLTYRDTSNASDVEWERSVPIEAVNEGATHPPVIHEMGQDSPFAFVGGDDVLGGAVSVNPADKQKELTVIMDRGTTPSSVHVHPAETGTDGTYKINVRQGEDEQDIGSRVSVVVHAPLGDEALVYRQGNEPLTTGGTSFGELDKETGTLRTYTDQNGEVSVRVIQKPSILDRAWFFGRTVIYDFSIPGLGYLRFAVLTLLSLLLLGRRRRFRGVIG